MGQTVAASLTFSLYKFTHADRGKCGAQNGQTL